MSHSSPEVFTPDSFAEALRNKFTDISEIKNKAHYTYFLKYLGDDGLKAKTIVIEEDYINKDFLEDYAAYYAFNFKDYGKRCKRIHFFSTTITSTRLDEIILDGNEDLKTFWDTAYLGFIVVKPIPHTIIGYTILRPIKDQLDPISENFLRTYSIHLFGCKTEIKSLAFQEQDNVLSACATTALWSMLNKASIADNAVLKSPGRITKDAGIVRTDTRLFPNTDGLTLEQIIQAISASGLETDTYTRVESNIVSDDSSEDSVIINDESNGTYLNVERIKGVVNAYSTLGLPIILIAKIPFERTKDSLHALTVCGFKFGSNANTDSNTILKSSYIDTIYAHDDQYGPFSEISFIQSDEYGLNTNWKDMDKGNVVRLTYVECIIVPLYPKVRITFSAIDSLIQDLGLMIFDFLHQFSENDKYIPVSDLKSLNWDIKLRFSEHYKSSIRKSPLPENIKIPFLIKGLPKYIWVATCSFKGQVILDIAFDATDISNAMCAISSFCYLDIEMKDLLHDFLDKNKATYQDRFDHKKSREYFSFLLDALKQ